MNKVAITLAFVVAILFGYLANDINVHAQAITPTTPGMYQGVGVHTSCPVSTAGVSNVCIAGDGVWISTNGGAYFQVGAAAAVTNAVLKVNGKNPDASGNVQLSGVVAPGAVVAVGAAPVVTQPTFTVTLQ